MRKKTVFTFCDNHAHLNSYSRYRRAEFVCEGGPGGGFNTPAAPCSEKRCVVRPGLDLFAPDCTDEEFDDLIAQWGCNRS